MNQCRLCIRTLARSTTNVPATRLAPRNARWLGTIQTLTTDPVVTQGEKDVAGDSALKWDPKPTTHLRMIDYVMGRGRAPVTLRSVDIRRLLMKKERLQRAVKVKRKKNSEKKAMGIWLKSPLWQRNMHKLLQYYDRRKTDTYLQVREPIPVNSYWANKALARMAADEDPKPVFMRGDGIVYTYRWEQAALWLMHHDPNKALAFLRATIDLPSLTMSHYQVMVKYLIDHYFHHGSDIEASTGEDPAEQLLALLPYVRLRGGKKYDTVIWRLLSMCRPDAALRLYLIARDSGILLTYLTWLHFATSLAKMGKFELALEAIFSASSRGAQINHMPFASNCATLLRKAVRERDGLRICLRLIDHLTKLGLEASVNVWNILILNAAEAGDTSTALSIYRSMEEHGLEKDKYTFAAVLKACKSSIDDAELLNNTIREAIDASRVMGHPYVATEILHCLKLHHSRKEPTRAFEIIADAYAELFNLPVLQKLGILTSRTQTDPENKLEVNPAAFGIMFTAYLEHVLVNKLPRQSVENVYTRFRELVLAGEEPYASLAQHSWIHDNFLQYFTRSEKGLTMAAQLIKDLQASLPEVYKHPLPKPSALTWTLFLYGFIQHGKMELAEKILDHMHKLGLEPLRGTHNNMILGYAKLQDLDGTVDAIRRLEAAGHVWDDYTFRAVKRLRDQEKMQAMYMQLNPALETDFTRDIKDGLGARLADDAGEQSEAGTDGGKAMYKPFEPQHDTQELVDGSDATKA